MFPGPARAILLLNENGNNEGEPVLNIRRERLLRDRLDPLQVPNEHLLRYYRLPRNNILELCDLLAPELEHPTRRSQSLSVMLQVLIGLRFLASGGFQSLLGDIAHVSQSTCSRVLTNFCTSLRNVGNNIRYPLNDRHYTIAVKESFHAIDGMPNVIGAIDCTHVLLMPPRVEKANYINRKGQTSLNIQAVCDAQLRIVNLVVRWPGSTHDSFIWDNCELKHQLHQHICPGSYLLGDSGYPLGQYLLTPIRNPRTPAEERYNESHIRTRNTIERCFGLLKSRFRALHSSGGVLMYVPEKVQNIIIAACILHNICINRGIPLNENDVLPLDIQPPQEIGIVMNRPVVGEQIRNEVVARYRQ